MPDGQLLVAWQAGDRRAGEQLVARHGRALASFFRQRVRSESVSDLVQETFLTLCETHTRIRSHTSFRAFAFGVARRKLLEFRRSKETLPLTDSLELPASRADSTAERDWLERKRLRSLAIAAFRELPLDDQILLELHEYQGLKRRELAEVFDVPLGVIGGRVHRARQKLRRIVERLSRDPGDVASTETSLHAYWEGLQAASGT